MDREVGLAVLETHCRPASELARSVEDLRNAPDLHYIVVADYDVKRGRFISKRTASLGR
ncbi:hypothetical protein [Enterovirga aerilata]|uniref:Uncharacterized protein n=1 Tax=Enterovirga aerilata TaxID=2730920 RepID=A0A849ICE1_9HYPH|nr:hypothetical protein [Enterovirga sp. DB1703]NNM73915.1 hypothetical protein [Enterovirga sp. DB1703]